MTLAEIRNEIWQNSGKLSYLDPSTDTSYNGGPYLNYVVNLAQKQVSMYKSITGRLLRFPNLMGELFFKEEPKSGTLGTGSTTTTLVLSGFSTDDDRYNGWNITIEGSTYLIMDYTGATQVAEIQEALSTAPSAGTAFTLQKSFNLLLPSTHAWVSEHIQLPVESDRWRSDGNFLEIVKVSDVQNGLELTRAQRGLNFITMRTSTGTPSQWYRFGNKLYFDVAPDDSRWYQMEYYRLPTTLSNDTDAPEIPEQFHYALVLWGTEWAYRQSGESNEKYSTKRDYIDFMERTMLNEDIKGERSNERGTLRRR